MHQCFLSRLIFAVYLVLLCTWLSAPSGGDDAGELLRHRYQVLPVHFIRSSWSYSDKTVSRGIELKPARRYTCSPALFKYIWEREREREREGGGERQRNGERETGGGTRGSRENCSYHTFAWVNLFLLIAGAFLCSEWKRGVRINVVINKYSFIYSFNLVRNNYFRGWFCTWHS